MALNSEIWWAAANAGPFPPDKPRSFTATASGQSIRLRARTDANGSPITKWQYRVGMTAESVSGAWTDISSSDSEALDFTLQVGIAQTRYFQVRAVNAVGTGDASDVAGATTATIAPLTPTGFTVTTEGQAFRLRASVNNGGSAITKWQYKIASSAGGLASASWTDIGSSANDDLDWTSGNIGWKTTRFFQVRAVNNIGNGQTSATVSATTASEPGRPTSFSVTAFGRAFRLRASAVNNGTAITKWQYKIATSSGGLSSASWTDVPDSGGNDLDWTTANIDFAVTRYFQVRAVNAAGNSPASATASATTSAGGPSQPTSFRVTAVGQGFRLRADVEINGSAIIRWQYKIATTSGGLASASWNNIGSSASDALDFTTGNIGRGTTRHFQVRAVNGIGNGPESSIASATTEAAAAPSQPTGFSVTATNRAFRLRASVAANGAAISKWQYRIATSANGLASASWQDISGSANSSLDWTTGNIGYSATRYFQVRAVNAVDNGPASASANATTRAQQEPGAVRNLTASASQAQTLAVSFDAPNSGDPADRYEHRQQSLARSWDSGLRVPSQSGGIQISGLAVAPNGDILVYINAARGTENDGIYRYNGSAWDSGFAAPAVQGGFTGLAVAPNGDILIVNNNAGRIYRYSGGAWDSGFAVPTALTNPGGLAVAPNGDFLVVDFNNNRIYRYDGSAWDSGFAGPSALTNPTGVEVAPNGDILVVGIGSRSIYRYDGSAWDSGFAGPSALTNPGGLAVAPNGDILVVNNANAGPVFRNSLGAQSAWQSIGTNRSFTLSSLLAGTEYKIDVRGVNAAGNGAVASVQATTSA